MHLEIHFSFILSNGLYVATLYIILHIVPFPSVYLYGFPPKAKNVCITIGSVKWELVTGQHRGGGRDPDWVRR